MKKTPAVVSVKTLSRKMRKSGQTLEFALGGRRERMRKLARTTRRSCVKAMMRVAQGKPTRAKRRGRASGKIMPPIEPPVAASPVARALEVLKK